MGHFPIRKRQDLQSKSQDLNLKHFALILLNLSGFIYYLLNEDNTTLTVTIKKKNAPQYEQQSSNS